MTKEQKFFGAFFQKRTACFLVLTMGLALGGLGGQASLGREARDNIAASGAQFGAEPGLPRRKGGLQ